MKNRWALRLAALTLVSCLAMSGVSLAVEPGSASDPLVTLSYLNDVFLGQIMTKVDQKITARNSQLLQQSGGAGGMSSVEFAVVTLSKGQVLTGDIGCEVMLRVGTASCVSPSNPGLIDETTAASLNNFSSPTVIIISLGSPSPLKASSISPRLLIPINSSITYLHFLIFLE